MSQANRGREGSLKEDASENWIGRDNGRGHHLNFSHPRDWDATDHIVRPTRQRGGGQSQKGAPL